MGIDFFVSPFSLNHQILLHKKKLPHLVLCLKICVLLVINLIDQNCSEDELHATVLR